MTVHRFTDGIPYRGPSTVMIVMLLISANFLLRYSCVWWIVHIFQAPPSVSMFLPVGTAFGSRVDPGPFLWFLRCCGCWAGYQATFWVGGGVPEAYFLLAVQHAFIGLDSLELLGLVLVYECPFFALRWSIDGIQQGGVVWRLLGAVPQH